MRNRNARSQYEDEAYDFERGLKDLFVNAIKWQTLFRCAECGSYWEQTNPHSELQGGGPMLLTRVSREHVEHEWAFFLAYQWKAGTVACVIDSLRSVIRHRGRKAGVSRRQSLLIAKEVASQSGWEWKEPVRVRYGKDDYLYGGTGFYTVVTDLQMSGADIVIVIGAEDGRVLRVGRRPGR
jgi:hypothetical protein